jgi:preprotein translocase subunit SecG
LLTLVLTFHVVICICLVLVVLFQQTKGAGLGGIFGGEVGGSVFGPSTGTILTRATTVLAITFMVTSLVLAVMGPRKRVSIIKEENVQTGQTVEVPSAQQEAPVAESQTK